MRTRITTQLPLDEQWETAWALVNRSFRSPLHYAFASVNPDGTPHVTPIGSLLLREDEPTGFYFRDIHFESIEPVRLGPMTQGLWQPARDDHLLGVKVVMRESE